VVEPFERQQTVEDICLRNKLRALIAAWLNVSVMSRRFFYGTMPLYMCAVITVFHNTSTSAGENEKN